MLSVQSLNQPQPEVLPIVFGDDTLTVTYNLSAVSPDHMDGIFVRPVRHQLVDILLDWDLPTSPEDPTPYVPAPLTEDELAGRSPVATVIPVAPIVPAPASSKRKAAAAVAPIDTAVPLTPAQIETERKDRWRILLGTLPQDFLLQVYDKLREDFRPGKRRATS